jgi:peptidoglycan/xylan/chitin deacetylase (PgdA/CDA1 family)
MLTVLLYHGVTDKESFGVENYSCKHINAHDFERQMVYLKKNCVTISMDDVVDIVNNECSFPENAVAITFDDGFWNNASIAAPILDSLDLSATFYVCSGMIGTKKMFWVDEIEDCINLTNKNRFDIVLDQKKSFNLSKDHHKKECISYIKSYCKKIMKKDRLRVVSQLEDILGVHPSPEHAQNYRVMTWSEVKYLSSNKLFTVGGHTLNHDILTSVESVDAKTDIEECISLLESNLGKNVKHFSYPEGQNEHYSDAIINILKGAGIVCSPTAIDGQNSIDSDLFHLRRIMVGFMGRPFPGNLMSSADVSK